MSVPGGGGAPATGFPSKLGFPITELGGNIGVDAIVVYSRLKLLKLGFPIDWSSFSEFALL